MTNIRSPITVAVELDGSDQPLTGRVIPCNGDEHSFRGWLGLVAAIDQVLAAEGGSGTDGAERAA